MADMDNDNLRKLFVGGLHYETTDDSLSAFYQQWGEVVDVIVMRDSTTKRSRGFGFVTFSQAHMVDDALKSRPHIIDGKQVDPKRATPKEEAGNPVARASVKKVFVGGIRDVTENSDLLDYFSQFGTVTSADIVMDKTTGRKRGFAFVSFDDWDSVDKCVLVQNHSLNGNPCEVKKAVERGMEGSSMGRGGGRGGGRGAPGGGRGGRGASMGGGYSSYGASTGGYGAYGSSGGDYSAYASSGYPSAGYGAAAGGWGQPAYADPYASGAGFGTGYGTSNGGGAMKSSGGYASRSAGPYAAGGAYATQGTSAGAYGSAGDYGSYGAAPSYGGAVYGGAYGQS
jgi:heterogeneous nuclear ribonucleoprotein A1/A3